MNTLKNNRWLSIITIVFLVANIITLVLLWQQNKPIRNDRRNMPRDAQVFEFLSKELALDSLQKETYRKLRDDHQAIQRLLQDSIRKGKDAFFSLIQQRDVPDSLLQERSKKIAEFEQQMDLITFRHFQQVRAFCNPLQQEKFDTLIQDILR